MSIEKSTRSVALIVLLVMVLIVNPFLSSSYLNVHAIPGMTISFDDVDGVTYYSYADLRIKGSVVYQSTERATAAYIKLYSNDSNAWIVKNDSVYEAIGTSTSSAISLTVHNNSGDYHDWQLYISDAKDNLPYGNYTAYISFEYGGEFVTSENTLEFNYAYSDGPSGNVSIEQNYDSITSELLDLNFSASTDGNIEDVYLIIKSLVDENVEQYGYLNFVEINESYEIVRDCCNSIHLYLNPINNNTSWQIFLDVINMTGYENLQNGMYQVDLYGIDTYLYSDQLLDSKFFTIDNTGSNPPEENNPEVTDLSINGENINYDNAKSLTITGSTINTTESDVVNLSINSTTNGFSEVTTSSSINTSGDFSFNGLDLSNQPNSDSVIISANITDSTTSPYAITVSKNVQTPSVTDLSAIAGVGEGTATLSWTNIDKYTYEYQIRRGTSSDYALSQEIITITDITQDMTYMDTDLEDGVTYFYWVLAKSIKYGDTNYGEESLSVSIVADNPAPTLSASFSDMYNLDEIFYQDTSMWYATFAKEIEYSGYSWVSSPSEAFKVTIKNSITNETYEASLEENSEGLFAYYEPLRVGEYYTELLDKDSNVLDFGYFRVNNTDHPVITDINPKVLPYGHSLYDFSLTGINFNIFSNPSVSILSNLSSLTNQIDFELNLQSIDNNLWVEVATIDQFGMNTGVYDIQIADDNSTFVEILDNVKLQFTSSPIITKDLNPWAIKPGFYDQLNFNAQGEFFNSTNVYIAAIYGLDNNPVVSETIIVNKSDSYDTLDITFDSSFNLSSGSYEVMFYQDSVDVTNKIYTTHPIFINITNEPCITDVEIEAIDSLLINGINLENSTYFATIDEQSSNVSSVEYLNSESIRINLENPLTTGEYDIALFDTQNNQIPKEITFYFDDSMDYYPPEITLIGDSVIYLILGSNFTEPGYTAIDLPNSNDITNSVNVSGTVDTNTIGEYILRYNVSDSVNNQAEEKIRKVIVQSDSLELMPDSITSSEPVMGLLIEDSSNTLWTESDSLDVLIYHQGIEIFNAISNIAVSESQVMFNLDSLSDGIYQVKLYKDDTTLLGIIDLEVSSINVSPSAVKPNYVGSIEVFNDSPNQIFDLGNELNVSLVDKLGAVVKDLDNFTVTEDIVNNNSFVLENIDLTSLSNGHFYLSVKDLDAQELIGLDDFLITSQPYIYNEITPWAIPFGISDTYSIDIKGINLNGFNGIVKVINMESEQLHSSIDITNNTDNEHLIFTLTISDTDSVGEYFFDVLDTFDENVDCEYSPVISIKEGPFIYDANMLNNNTIEIYGYNLTGTNVLAFINENTIENNAVLIDENTITITTTQPLTFGDYSINIFLDGSSEPLERELWISSSLDLTPPEITIIGDSEVYTKVGSVYVDDGATALDDVDGNITDNINVVNNVNTIVIDSYTVTYNVTDNAGNPAVEKVRTVHVVEELPTSYIDFEPTWLEGGISDTQNITIYETNQDLWAANDSNLGINLLSGSEAVGLEGKTLNITEVGDDYISVELSGFSDQLYGIDIYNTNTSEILAKSQEYLEISSLEVLPKAINTAYKGEIELILINNAINLNQGETTQLELVGANRSGYGLIGQQTITEEDVLSRSVIFEVDLRQDGLIEGIYNLDLVNNTQKLGSAKIIITEQPYFFSDIKPWALEQNSTETITLTLTGINLGSFGGSFTVVDNNDVQVGSTSSYQLDDNQDLEVTFNSLNLDSGEYFIKASDEEELDSEEMSLKVISSTETAVLDAEISDGNIIIYGINFNNLSTPKVFIEDFEATNVLIDSDLDTITANIPPAFILTNGQGYNIDVTDMGIRIQNSVYIEYYDESIPDMVITSIDSDVDKVYYGGQEIKFNIDNINVTNGGSPAIKLYSKSVDGHFISKPSCLGQPQNEEGYILGKISQIGGYDFSTVVSNSNSSSTPLYIEIGNFDGTNYFTTQEEPVPLIDSSTSFPIMTNLYPPEYPFEKGLLLVTEPEFSTIDNLRSIQKLTFNVLLDDGNETKVGAIEIGSQEKPIDALAVDNNGVPQLLKLLDAFSIELTEEGSLIAGINTEELTFLAETPANIYFYNLDDFFGFNVTEHNFEYLLELVARNNDGSIFSNVSELLSGDITYNDINDQITIPINHFSTYELVPAEIDISISSTNINSEYAKAGDIVKLQISPNKIINPPSAFIDESVINTVYDSDSNVYTANYTVKDESPNGQLAFIIDLDGATYDTTTDNSSVIIDTTVPVVSANIDTEVITQSDVTISYIITEDNLDSQSSTVAINSASPIEVVYPKIFTEEAIYEFNVEATDLAGNVGSDSVIFEIDRTPPEISPSFIEGLVTAENVDVTYSVIEKNIDTHSAILTKDGLNPIVISSQSATSISEEGQYQLNVIATDLAGNSIEETYNFEINKDLPMINIHTILNGEYYNHPVLIDVEVHYGEVSNMVLTRDSNPTFVENLTSVVTDGVYKLTVNAINPVNNLTSTKTVNFTIDKQKPLIDFSQSSVDDGVISNNDVTLVTIIQDQGPAGIHPISYGGFSMVEDGVYRKQEVFTDEGEYNYSVVVYDNANNMESKLMKFTIDKTPATTEVDTIPDIPRSGVFNTDVKVYFSTTLDPTNIKFSLDNGITFEDYNASQPVNISKEGINNILYYSIDRAGNEEEVKVIEIKIDKTPPTTSISLTPEMPVSGIYNSDVVIELATEEEGTVMHSVDGINFSETNTSEPMLFGKEGTFKLWYYSVDYAGNVEDENIIEFKVDKTKPLVETKISSNNSNDAYAKIGDVITLEIESNEELDSIEVMIADKEASISEVGIKLYNATTEVTSQLSEGEVEFIVTAKDLAGNITNNVSTIDQSNVTIDKTIPTIVFETIPETPDGKNDYYITQPIIELISNEEGNIFYSLNNSDFILHQGNIVVPVGEQSYKFYAADLAGNQSLVDTIEIKYDDQVPFIDYVIEKSNKEAFRSGDVLEILSFGSNGCIVNAYLDKIKVELVESREFPGYYAGSYTVKDGDNFSGNIVVKYELMTGSTNELEGSKIEIDTLIPEIANLITNDTLFVQGDVVEIELIGESNGKAWISFEGYSVPSIDSDKLTLIETAPNSYTGNFDVISGMNSNDINFTGYLKDSSGNIGELELTETISFDTNNPRVNIKIDGTLGKNGYYIDEPTVTIITTDANSPIAFYDLSNGDETLYQNPFVVKEGNNEILYRAIDSFNNKTPETGYRQVIINVDTSNPEPPSGLKAYSGRNDVTNSVVNNDKIDVSGSVSLDSDAITAYLSINGADYIKTDIINNNFNFENILLTEVDNTIKVYVEDIAGNASDQSQFMVTKDNEGPIFEFEDVVNGAETEFIATASEVIDGTPETIIADVKLDGVDIAQGWIFTKDELNDRKYKSKQLLDENVDVLIEITAKDAAGNEETSQYNVSYISEDEDFLINLGLTRIRIPANSINNLNRFNSSPRIDASNVTGMIPFTSPRSFIVRDALGLNIGNRFNSPVLMSFYLGMPNDLNSMGLNQGSFYVARFNEETKEWEYLQYTYSPLTGFATIERLNFSTYGVFVDTIPPDLTILNPKDEEFIKTGKVLIEGNTEIGASLKVNLTDYTSEVNSDGSFSIEIDLIEGLNNLVISAKDEALNETVKEIKVIRDTIAPEIDTTLGNTYTNQEEITFSANVSDDNFNYSEILLDSLLVANSSVELLEANLNLIEEKEYIITVNAYDLAGNKTTVEKKVIKDVSVPSITNNQDKTTVTNQHINLIGNVSEDIEWLKIGGDTATITKKAYSYSNYSLTEGYNEIEISAKDLAGNIGSITIGISYDPNAPQFNIITPSTTSYIKESYINVNGSGINGDRVTYKLNSNNFAYSIIDNEEFNQTITGLIDGENTLEIIVFDDYDRSSNWIGKVYVDNMSPAIDISSHENNETVYTSNITLIGTITDNISNDISLKVGIEDVPLVNGIFNTSINLTTGDNDIVLIAIDEAGNESSKRLNIIYKTQSSSSSKNGDNSSSIYNDDASRIISKDSLTYKEVLMDNRMIDSYEVPLIELLKSRAQARKENLPVEFDLSSSENKNQLLTLSNSQVGLLKEDGIALLTRYGTKIDLTPEILNKINDKGIELVVEIEEVAITDLDAEGKILRAEDIKTNFAGKTKLRFNVNEESNLNNLMIKVMHSDGSIEVIKPMIVNEGANNYLEIEVDNFSTFIIYQKFENVIKLKLGSINANKNGLEYQLDAMPYLDVDNNRTLVPVRFVAEALQAKVNWIASERKVEIIDGRTIILTIDSNKVFVDGLVDEIDTQAIIKDSRTYVPLRFISETLGASVEFNSSTKEITINK